MKKILVSDSFSTEKICATLSQLYGEQATVYGKEGNVASGDILAPFAKMAAQRGAPPMTEAKEGQKFDLFFVSARLVIEGSIKPNELKKNLGTENAKVVAMSIMTDYLDEVKKMNVGADFFHYKKNITDPTGKLTEDEQNELTTFITT